MPKYPTNCSVGFDLAANEDVEIPPKSWRIIGTGLYFEIPVNYEVQIRARSGLASKGINLMNQPGTVDQDYRGEIRVILHNNNTKPWKVSRGNRIAQAVVSPVLHAIMIDSETLTPTERGEGGLGSTGE
jgi:dUTP pyrophosphatase